MVCNGFGPLSGDYAHHRNWAHVARVGPRDDQHENRSGLG